MSEEIHNASTVVPRSIAVSVILNGILGFSMLLAELFCIGDASAVLNQQFPFMTIFLNATQSVAGAAIMVSVIVLLSLCSTIGLLASASRMLWAFSRDRGVPGWRFVSKVSALAHTNLYTLLRSAGTSEGLGPNQRCPYHNHHHSAHWPYQYWLPHSV